MMETSSRLRSILERICEVIWAIALICLPLTSFPLLSSLSGGIVAPFSILPFYVLLVIWSLPLLIRKGSLPKETIPLVVFIFVVIISCAAAYFFFIPGFRGRSVPGQEIRALFTLGVGLTFYLVTTTWVTDIRKLQSSWKYITIGGILSLLWTGLQAFYIFRQADLYPSWMNQIQSWLAVLSPAYSPRFGRVNGLTYEASWFAHQMVMIYLPLWIAASYHKTSAFNFRIFRVTAENILVVLGLGAFFLSSPRIGLVSFIIIIIYLFIRLNLSLHRKIVDHLSSKPISSASPSKHRIWIQLATSLSIIMIYGLLIAGIFFFAVQRDWRLNILVSNPPTVKDIVGLLTLNQDTLLRLSHRFIFLERMIYWLSGWNVFNQYPWFGVGLGNSGFFFPIFAPAMGWATFEIRNVLFYLNQLPNIKSMWIRLLAETGLVGFSVFLSWFYILFKSSWFSQRNENATIKTFAFAGQLALLAFIGEGFSIDSFALPYLWIIAGLIGAIALIHRRSSTYNQNQSLSTKEN